MNLVVWGLGKHANNKILPAIKRSNKFNLYGVCSRNNDSVERVKRSYKTKGWISSIEMFEDKNIDAIYLSTPPALHKMQADSILDNNLHLLCEKPITTSHEDTAQLVEKAISKKLSLMEGLMYLYHPQHKALKNLLNKKKLGEIHTIKASFQLPPLDNSGYRKDKILGASAIYDLGIYPVSLILDFYDISKIELIKKEINYDKSLNYDISGKVFLEINNNIDCVLDWSYDKTYINELSITGENLGLHSTFVFSKDLKQKTNILLFEEEELTENIEVGEADHFELMLKSFAESIESPLNHNLDSSSMLNLSRFLNELTR